MRVIEYGRKDPPPETSAHLNPAHIVGVEVFRARYSKTFEVVVTDVLNRRWRFGDPEEGTFTSFEEADETASKLARGQG